MSSRAAPRKAPASTPIGAALGISEKDFQRNVMRAAELFGWLAYHSFDSRRSQPGFPDLVLVRKPRIIFAELKRRNGRLTFAQRVWMAALEHTPVETYIWRPSDWRSIEEVLRK